LYDQVKYLQRRLVYAPPNDAVEAKKGNALTSLNISRFERHIHVCVHRETAEDLSRLMTVR
jgi:hypothetical protein